MANSLQDQLKKAGLIDAKRAKKVERAKNTQEKLQRKSKQPIVDESKQELEQAKVEKTAKDRELNQARNDKAARKALAAQIKQLIESNTVIADGDQEFNFADGKKVKKIYVTSKLANHLSRGILTIVKQGDQYILVPTPVADRIAERDPSRIVFKADLNESDVDEDDPYADYQIPDDLMW
ncbi:MAG: nucleoprotein/polynucleotide-associated enzyme [Gammaproteobacteria bacterium]|nr:MAG: nucleoprotein/polynucleotide-associated enzyme [Gammaproteobacteria bacterium]